MRKLLPLLAALAVTLGLLVPSANTARHGTLAGPRYSARQVAALEYLTCPGWRDARALVRAVAVTLAESQGYTRAFNDNRDSAGRVTSRDVGLLEVNIPAAQIGTSAEEALYDPGTNVRRGCDLYTARGFQPWAAFNSRVFLHDTYLQRATLGVANFLARGLTDDARSAGQVPVTRAPWVSLPNLRKLYPTVPLF